MEDTGASAKAEQALVSDQAAERLDPTGFDPSRFMPISDALLLVILAYIVGFWGGAA